MSEWYDNQKKPASNFRKLLQEQIEKANPRRNLTAENTLKAQEGLNWKATRGLPEMMADAWR